MKPLLFALFLMCSTLAVRAQEITFDHRIASVDGKPCLQIKPSDANDISFLNMDGEELFFLKYTNSQITGTRYCKVLFIKQRAQLTASNYMFTQKDLVKKLIKEGVIKDGALVDDKVELFIAKWDERVIE